jgi:hypothetical protein
MLSVWNISEGTSYLEQATFRKKSPCAQRVLRYGDLGSHRIVTWRLKAGIMEPEETYFASRRLGKHVPAAKNTQATLEVFLETMFSIRSVQSVYRRRKFRFRSDVCSWDLKGGCPVQLFWTRVGEGRPWAREAEEFPVIEAVARERLMKTQ